MLQSDEPPDRFRRVLDDFMSMYNAQTTLSVIHTHERIRLSVYRRESDADGVTSEIVIASKKAEAIGTSVMNNTQ